MVPLSQRPQFFSPFLSFLLTPFVCEQSSVLSCAVLCCAVLCCAVLCCAVLCCAVLCCAVLCCCYVAGVLSCAHATSESLYPDKTDPPPTDRRASTAPPVGFSTAGSTAGFSTGGSRGGDPS